MPLREIFYLKSRWPRIVTSLLLLLVVGCCSLPDLPEGTPLKDTERSRVVVVHGLFRSHRAMKPLHPALKDAGFEVIEYRYPSTRQGVDELPVGLREHLIQQVEDDPHGRLHVVGHSLGAVISLRATSPAIDGIGRVVQISPPNQGSPVADTFEDLLGPWVAPIRELATTAGGPLPEGISPGVETGVIAADRDVMVPIPYTRLEGASDWIHLPGSHTFVFWRSRTQQEIIHFLLHGRFSDEAPRP